ncbi:FCD domain-containing protein [Saccharomonospora sp. NPDC006951]
MSSEAAAPNIRRLHTHEQVLAAIQQRILGSGLGAGDALPAERDLADSLGSSRSGVRKALRVLESLGLVRDEAGNWVLTGNSSTALANLLRLRMALAGFRLTDLVEVRVQLERSAATRAAEAATSEDLGRLRDILNSMSEPGISTNRFNALDTEFHVALARASHNALAVELMQSLRDAVQAGMTTAFTSIRDWPGTAHRLSEEHDAVLDAIETGDGALAARRIGAHVSDFYRAAG